jgi:hypothetical protein
MDRPAAGTRYILDHAGEEAGAALYQGHAHRPDASLPLQARVSLTDGRVQASLSGMDDAAEQERLEREAAALVRAATKGREAMPRRIVRWRG